MFNIGGHLDYKGQQYRNNLYLDFVNRFRVCHDFMGRNWKDGIPGTIVFVAVDEQLVWWPRR